MTKLLPQYNSVVTSFEAAFSFHRSFTLALDPVRFLVDMRLLFYSEGGCRFLDDDYCRRRWPNDESTKVTTADDDDDDEYDDSKLLLRGISVAVGMRLQRHRLG